MMYRTPLHVLCCSLLFCALCLASAGVGSTPSGSGLLPVAQAASAALHGNPNSHIYHGPSCRYYHCKACTMPFSSRQEAEAAGYRPCKVCGGR
ncbi:sunset domain-containing protein [Megalodesulfovibrio paquesii]